MIATNPNNCFLTSSYFSHFLSSFDTHLQADRIRGTNSNLISHGQNDIRQLAGSDGVGVTVDVDASGNVVDVLGNLYGNGVPPPTVSWQEKFVVSSANLSLTMSALQLKRVLLLLQPVS